MTAWEERHELYRLEARTWVPEGEFECHAFREFIADRITREELDERRIASQMENNPLSMETLIRYEQQRARAKAIGHLVTSRSQRSGRPKTNGLVDKTVRLEKGAVYTVSGVGYNQNGYCLAIKELGGYWFQADVFDLVPDGPDGRAGQL